MAKIYANTMIASAGVVQVLDDAGAVMYSYQAVFPSLRNVDFGDNQDYIVKPNDTWQGLAFNFYGNASFWWMICEFNRVLDPFTELVPGNRIIIPSAARVRASLTAATDV